jgi:hypothetical protein
MSEGREAVGAMLTEFSGVVSFYQSDSNLFQLFKDG